MKPHFLALIFVILLAGAVRAAEEDAATSENPMTARFRETRAKIELLYGRRAENAQRPDPRYNPFRTNSYLASVAVLNNPNPSTSSSNVDATTDSGILQIAANQLDIGGTMTREGIVMASTFKGNYEVGKRISVVINGTTYYIQVLSANVNGVTIGLNSAVLLIPFYP